MGTTSLGAITPLATFCRFFVTRPLNVFLITEKTERLALCMLTDTDISDRHQGNILPHLLQI